MAIENRPGRFTITKEAGRWQIYARTCAWLGSEQTYDEAVRFVDQHCSGWKVTPRDMPPLGAPSWPSHRVIDPFWTRERP